MRLSEPLRTMHPEVNWRSIRGFRNIVVHDYVDVELDAVWQIAVNDLPVLKTAVQTLQNQNNGTGNP
jgi:uncharacterized protein with HEPN domain